MLFKDFLGTVTQMSHCDEVYEGRWLCKYTFAKSCLCTEATLHSCVCTGSSLQDILYEWSLFRQVIWQRQTQTAQETTLSTIMTRGYKISQTFKSDIIQSGYVFQKACTPLGKNWVEVRVSKSLPEFTDALPSTRYIWSFPMPKNTSLPMHK